MRRGWGVGTNYVGGPTRVGRVARGSIARPWEGGRMDAWPIVLFLANQFSTYSPESIFDVRGRTVLAKAVPCGRGLVQW